MQRLSGFVCVLSLCTAGIAGAADYKPELSQPGKDVMWVPTPDALVNTMLDLAKLTANDYLIDLGSGDGRLVMMAAKRGARAHGIEYNEKLLAYAVRQAKEAGLTDKATFAKADFFETDLAAASVITLFLSPEINLKLRPKLMNLKPGTRVISNTFNMGDWTPDDKAVSADEARSVYYRHALLWVVPAKVNGAWQSPQGRLRLTQRYQKIDGTLQVKGKVMPIANAALRGDRISFSVVDVRYAGTVNDNVIEGTVTQGENTQPWRATRAPK